MKKVAVILVITDGNPDQTDDLDYWCQEVMMPFVIELAPKWRRDIAAQVNDGCLNLDALNGSVDDQLYRLWQQPFKVLTVTGEEIGCIQRFIRYFPSSQTVVLGLEKDMNHFPVTPSSLFPNGGIEFYQKYLILQLQDNRIGSIVAGPIIEWDTLTEEQLKDIVAAAELPCLLHHKS